MSAYYIQISPSSNKGKKYKAVFFDRDMKKIKTTNFGASGYSDYTEHQDDERKQRYLDRHRDKENWNDPMTAGALSRFILWSKPSLTEAKKAYAKRFGLKLI